MAMNHPVMHNQMASSGGPVGVSQSSMPQPTNPGPCAVLVIEYTKPAVDSGGAGNRFPRTIFMLDSEDLQQAVHYFTGQWVRIRLISCAKPELIQTPPCELLGQSSPLLRTDTTRFSPVFALLPSDIREEDLRTLQQTLSQLHFPDEHGHPTVRLILTPRTHGHWEQILAPVVCHASPPVQDTMMSGPAATYPHRDDSMNAVSSGDSNGAMPPTDSDKSGFYAGNQYPSQPGASAAPTNFSSAPPVQHSVPSQIPDSRTVGGFQPSHNTGTAIGDGWSMRPSNRTDPSAANHRSTHPSQSRSSPPGAGHVGSPPGYHASGVPPRSSATSNPSFYPPSIARNRNGSPPVTQDSDHPEILAQSRHVSMVRFELVNMFCLEGKGFDVIEAVLGKNSVHVQYILSKAQGQVDLRLKGYASDQAPICDRAHIELKGTCSEVTYGAAEHVYDLLNSVRSQILEFAKSNNIAVPSEIGIKEHRYASQSGSDWSHNGQPQITWKYLNRHMR